MHSGDGLDRTWTGPTRAQATACTTPNNQEYTHALPTYGYIAQWLERLTADQQVPGSNPGVPFLSGVSRSVPHHVALATRAGTKNDVNRKPAHQKMRNLRCWSQTRCPRAVPPASSCFSFEAASSIAPGVCGSATASRCLCTHSFFFAKPSQLEHLVISNQYQPISLCKMTPVGFEPTPFRNGALSHRLRPLGQSVAVVGV